MLGGPEPEVAQEPTPLERLADWKAAWRADVRSFVRRQFSPQYRAARRAEADRAVVERRRVVRAATFAQVPLLNAAQVVTSWREILPPLAEADGRRIPLELDQPGVYVVEAVHDRLRAYTIVVISDVGLVTKSAPGQLLVYTADRFTGEPVAGCGLVLLADQAVAARGETAADGTYTAAVDVKPDNVVVVATCGRQVAVSDPGAWYLRETPRDLVGYVYTDKPIYRPGHTVRLKAVLRWRTRGALVRFDRPQVEVTIADTNSKVLLRETRKVDEFGSVNTSWQVPVTAALGYYSIRVHSEDDEAFGHFEVQEYRRPEFEVKVTSPDRFVVQGGRTTATIEAKYLLRAAGRRRAREVRPLARLLRLAPALDRRAGRRRRLVRRQRRRRADRRARRARARHGDRAGARPRRRQPAGPGLLAAHHRARHRRQRPRGFGRRDRLRHLRHVHGDREREPVPLPAGRDGRARGARDRLRRHAAAADRDEGLARAPALHARVRRARVHGGRAGNGRDRRRRTRPLDDHDPGRARQLPLPRGRPGGRPLRGGHGLHLGARPGGRRGRRRSVPGAAAGPEGVPARRRGEARAARRAGGRRGARDQGGLADHLAPRHAARRQRDRRGAHRRGRHRRHLRERALREGRSAVPGREAPARARDLARACRCRSRRRRPCRGRASPASSRSARRVPTAGPSAPRSACR